MNTVVRTLFTLTSLITLLNSLHAQWLCNGGPYGRYSHSLAVNGTTLYAGTTNTISHEGGVYTSTDNGLNWKQMNTGLGNTQVLALGSSQAGVFAGTEDGVYVYSGLNKSWNLSGLTYQQTSNTMGVRGFAFSGSTVFAIGDSLYRSTNSGATWTKVMSGMSNVFIFDLAVAGSNIYAATTSGVYVSSNNGTSWKAAGAVGSEVQVLAVSGTIIFAGGGDRAVYRSTDNGASWTNIGLRLHTIADLAVCGTNLFAATDAGIFRAAVTDTVWTLVNNGLKFSAAAVNPPTLVSAFAVSNTTIYAWTYAGGVYASTNNGDSWSNSGISSSVINSLAVLDSNLFAGTFDGVYRSADCGSHWSESNNGLTLSTSSGYPLQGISAIAVSGSTILAGAVANGIFRSTDKGSTWNAANTGMSVDRSFEVRAFVVSSSTVFAATDKGVYRSTNNGSSWADANTGLTDTNIKTLTGSGTDLYAVTFNYEAFRSIDNGDHWTKISTLLPERNIAAFASFGNDLFASFGFGLYRSSDKGVTWTSAYAGMENTYVSTVAASGQYLFAGTDHGVYYSSNKGAAWTNAGTTSLDARVLAVSQGNLVVGAYGMGIWKRPITEIVTATASNLAGSPDQFTLGQNYPNPFNPSTTIAFDIPARSVTTLKVFDVMGREVATLASGVLAAGSHHYQWNAGGMPSGVYFYRLQSGEFTKTKQLLLLR